MSKILEVCCGSYYDALKAEYGGATRIELNSALYMGGLTPSLATLKKVKENTKLKVICMVRNRGAGFCYLKEDIEVMFEDARILLENKADGLAFGFLKEDKTIDKQLTQKMVELIHSYGKEAVFHRAIDMCSDYAKAFQDIVQCKVDRVLTSGAHNNVVEGIDNIKAMQKIYNQKIEILAGCGINENNAEYVLNKTGINQIHSSCKGHLQDITTSNDSVDFSFMEKNFYDVVDENRVKAILKNIHMVDE